MGFAISIVRPLSLLLTKRDWRGQDRVPRTGGVIIAANHLSWLDPFALSHFVYDVGRLPRFMAKESLFRARFVGRVMRGADQIPVRRGQRDASAALSNAVQALDNGEAVMIYPEGTITRDPELWPMQAKTGVARLALLSGAPIVPIAQWGAQEILPYNSRRVRLFPRHTVHERAAAPLYPDRLPPGEQPSREALDALTAEVMLRIRNELADIRGEPAPSGIWDPRAGERVPSPTDVRGRDEGAA
jgi:1-acyl-sn-glycerol-3-phosphate acyltransferase